MEIFLENKKRKEQKFFAHKKMSLNWLMYVQTLGKSRKRMFQQKSFQMLTN